MEVAQMLKYISNLPFSTPSQDLLLLGGRDVRPRVRLHRHQQERDARVPRLPLPQEENGKKER